MQILRPSPIVQSTVLAVAMCGATFSSSFAAEIKSTPLKSSDVAIISINGEIKEGDLRKFKQLAIKYDSAIVVLNSDGGLTYEALEIGRIIQIKGYPTLVTAEFECSSACALIWIAGKKRFLGDGAKVGFHATYLDSNGKKIESGVGNAIVGNYLASLRLSEDAIIFATSAPPSKLNYLTLSNARTAGIDVEQFSIDEKPASGTVSSKKTNDQVNEITDYATVDNWLIKIDTTMNNGCFMLGSFVGGTAIRFGYDNRSSLSSILVIGSENWKSLEAGEKYNIVVQFNDEEPWMINSVGTLFGDTTMLMANFTDTNFKFQNEFSSANTVKISYKDRSVAKLSLLNVDRAIKSMVTCQLNQKSPRDPFAQ